jgi:hypothetical protein
MESCNVTREPDIENIRQAFRRISSLAALLAHRTLAPGKRIGIIFSGGNIDVAPLIRSLSRTT